MMKKAMNAVISLVLIFAFAGAAAADPPENIIIKFDHKEKTLTIEIIHDTKDVKSHYVKEAIVAVNGMLMIDQKAMSQYDGEKQLFKFVVVDAKEGDKIDVSAECSVFGKIKRSITIKAPAPEGAKKAKPVK